MKKETRYRFAYALFIALIFGILIVLFLSLQGCVTIKLEVPISEEKSVKAEYTRWFWQTLEGVSLKAPDGWELKIAKQKSIFDLYFDAGVIKGSLGSSEDD